MLLDSGAYDYLNANQTLLVEAVTALSPKCNYDIQAFAGNVLKKEIDSPAFLPMKHYLYDKGETMENLIAVMTVALTEQLIDG